VQQQSLMALVRNFVAIPVPTYRKEIVALVRALAAPDRRRQRVRDRAG
jgi:hypothetical protein